MDDPRAAGERDRSVIFAYIAIGAWGVFILILIALATDRGIIVACAIIYGPGVLWFLARVVTDRIAKARAEKESKTEIPHTH